MKQDWRLFHIILQSMMKFEFTNNFTPTILVKKTLDTNLGIFNNSCRKKKNALM